MPVLKLSQIAASAANFADGDSIVTVQSSAVDVRLTRTQLFGFPTLQLGSSDAAAPVAQTLQVQSVIAGTSDTAGVDWTFVGSKGTGTGAGGSIIFKTAPAGTTGTAQNAATTALTINSAQASIFAGQIQSAITIPIKFTAAFPQIQTPNLDITTGTATNTSIFYADNSKVFIISQLGIFPGGTAAVADVFLTRIAAATLQLGAADAAAPVAQTLQVQSVVAGTTDTAGVDWTFVGSKGTGTGSGGNILFNLAPAGTTGTTQNAAVQVLKITGGNSAATKPSIQVGSGSTTSAGLIIGYVGTSGYGGIWGTKTASPSNTNYNFATDGSSIFINGSAGITLANGATTVATITTAGITLTNTLSLLWGTDLILRRSAAATLQQGAADAAAPVAQTLQVQSVVAGTTDTAGVDWTFKGSKGTGTGKGGNIIFQVAPCSSGTGATAQNPVQTGLSITASSVATFTQQPSVVIGSSQLNSSAVEGFLYIPTVNGPPTGAPTTYTGRVPIVFDSSNNKLYIYNSSGATWVGGTVPGAWS